MSYAIRMKWRRRWLKSIAAPALLLMFLFAFYLTTFVLSLTVAFDH